MTLHDYLLQHLNHTAMIAISVDSKSSVQYNYWNWLHNQGQLHLLKNDMSIGHVLHGGSIQENEDGSLLYSSNLYPKSCILNFYFGGVNP